MSNNNNTNRPNHNDLERTLTSHMRTLSMIACSPHDAPSTSGAIAAQVSPPEAAHAAPSIRSVLATPSGAKMATVTSQRDDVQWDSGCSDTNDAELVSILGEACALNCMSCNASDDDDVDVGVSAVDDDDVMAVTSGAAAGQSQFELELDLELIEND